MDVIDRATPTIIKRYLATLTLKERVGLYSLYAEVACVALPFPSLLSLLSLLFHPIPPPSLHSLYTSLPLLPPTDRAPVYQSQSQSYLASRPLCLFPGTRR